MVGKGRIGVRVTVNVDVGFGTSEPGSNGVGVVLVHAPIKRVARNNCAKSFCISIIPEEEKDYEQGPKWK